MADDDIPRWRKRTPATATDDSVLIEWQSRYFKLRDDGYSKCESISQIAEEESLHFNTVYRHLNPRVKKMQRNYSKGRWQREKLSPGIRKRIRGYKDRYQIVRRAIDEAVTQAVTEADHPLTMECISESIQAQYGISMAPSTITNLLAKHEAKYGSKLLHEVPGSSPTAYVLSQMVDPSTIISSGK